MPRTRAQQQKQAQPTVDRESRAGDGGHDDIPGNVGGNESAFDFKDSEENEIYTCNTRKDKDKRICRHSFGVLFGCWPCGVGWVKLSFYSIESCFYSYTL